MNLADLTAMQARQALHAGKISSVELVQACLDQIAAREQTIGAWAFLDPEHALTQARNADRARQGGEALGPLHGIPVGVKDIFDTADMSTEDGTELHAGRTPAEDATVVALLRAAGAIIMGKTVTTELAVYAPGKTRNPHDPERTPGGSSSGSAAAVAADMVPLAIGTQTNGSVIRPASFCGVYGYKPTHGRISRHRVLQQSRALDQVGVFARDVVDAALLAEQLMGFDALDPDLRPRAQPPLVATATAEPPVPPTLAFVKTPAWDQAQASTKEAFAELNAHLCGHVSEAVLPSAFAGAYEWHRTVMEADLARSFAREYDAGADRLSHTLRQMIERGQRCLAVDYARALEQISFLCVLLDQFFESYDAVVTPAAPGEAPLGLDSTGDPVFCTLWTFCGVPTITLPVLQGANELPLGVQLVGARGEDARLLRTARWLVQRLETG